MADISLTASMRSNLLSLQKTQSLMDTTQERLSTGKKVNSAIDNPSSYYTAQSLNNRASDLSALLDSMGQGIQTIKAADEAIETITSFAQQAKAIANSARDVASNFDKYAMTSKEISDEVGEGKVLVDSREDMSKFTMTITEADKTATFTIYGADGKDEKIELNITKGTGASDAVTDSDVQNAVISALQKAGYNATLVKGTNDIEVSTTDGSAVSWVNGKEDTDGSYKGGLSESDSAAKVVNFKTEKTSAAVSAALDGQGGVTAAADGKTVVVTAPKNEFRIVDIEGTVAKDMGLAGSRKAGNPDVKSSERASYAKQFNEILSQIDQLAKDAGYKGINLLQENDLKVIFNEDRTSFIEIKGVDASSQGLGMSAAQGDWDRNSYIDAALESIEGAISKLRTYASDFGNNYSIVQTREDFTDNLINVLTEGADKLTLADMNEESANMLALQTRQQLAINSLSLASQAAQSVLKLF